MPAGFGYTAENCRVDAGGGLEAAGTAGAAGTGPPETAAVAALANSPAEANRSPGFFAIPFAMTSSNARGMPRRMMLGRGGGENMCAVIS